MAVGLGTPPQTVYFLADTGANNVAVQSSLLPANLQSGIPIYNPTKSSTARRLPGYTYQDTYNDYWDTGVVYNDVVTIGGVQFQNISICTMTNASRPSGANSRAGNMGLDLTTTMSTSPGGLKSFMYAVRSVLDGMLYLHSMLFISCVGITTHSFNSRRLVHYLQQHSRGRVRDF